MIEEFSNAVKAAINIQAPRHIREGMVSGMCNALLKAGYEKEEIREKLNAVVQKALVQRRDEAVVNELEIDMLIRMRSSI